MRIIRLLSKIKNCNKALTRTHCSEIPKIPTIGNVAIVTGASMGIGLECVKALLANGVQNIVAGDINTRIGEEEIKKLKRKYKASCITFAKCDTSIEDDIEKLFNTARSLHNNIDIVVNNAGTYDEEDWSKMIDVNMKGVFFASELAIDYMGAQKRKGGTIVNVSSTLGLEPIAGVPVYAATKNALIGYTRSIAESCRFTRAKKIRMMAMCPGMTDTNFNENMNKQKDAMAQQASEKLSGMYKQDPCFCGKCLIDMLYDGEPGSIWVTECDDVYRIHIPDRRCLKRRVTVLIPAKEKLFEGVKYAD